MVGRSLPDSNFRHDNIVAWLRLGENTFGFFFFLPASALRALCSPCVGHLYTMFENLVLGSCQWSAWRQKLREMQGDPPVLWWRGKLLGTPNGFHLVLISPPTSCGETCGNPWLVSRPAAPLPFVLVSNVGPVGWGKQLSLRDRKGSQKRPVSAGILFSVLDKPSSLQLGGHFLLRVWPPGRSWLEESPWWPGLLWQQTTSDSPQLEAE